MWRDGPNGERAWGLAALGDLEGDGAVDPGQE